MSIHAPLDRRPAGSPSWVQGWVIGLALLAPFLGGSTEHWSQGWIFMLSGLLVIIRPPPAAPPRFMVWVVGGLLSLGLCGFLPAAWFPSAGWREILRAAGAELPGTLSPQPWLTLEALLLFVGGAIWGCWLSAQNWTAVDRITLIRAFGVGIIAFAALALCFHEQGWHPAFWSAPRGFGPFPNRNQTGNFLALGGLLVLACVQRNWQRGGKSWPFWLLGYGVVLFAVFANYSRAGVGLLLGGSALWIALLWVLSGSGGRLAVGISGVFIVGSLFVLFGGETFQRFHTEFSAERGGWLGFRGLVFQDALRMIAADPWCGVGLGNFRALFPFFRTVSARDVTTLHPESDWLWAGVEIGWVGLLILVGGASALLVRAFPLAPGSARRLRVAALVATGGFLVHGLVDVSGHRLGTVIPALLVASLALRSEARSPSRWVPWFFRFSGLLLLVIGGAWVLGAAQSWPLPGALGVAQAKAQIPRLLAAGHADRATQLSTAALGWAPLDGELYFSRATVRAAQRDWLGAMADFRVARALQPISQERALAEGRLWLIVQPPLALTPWREALARCPPERAPAVWARILADAAAVPALRPALRELAGQDRARQLIYLPFAEPAAAREILAALLAADPALEKLSDLEKVRVFEIWTAHDDAAAWERAADRYPGWLRAGWQLLARRAAERADFERASRLAFTYLPPPELPAMLQPAPTLGSLQRRVLAHPEDFAAAYALSAAHLSAGRKEEALATVQRATAQPGHPLYFRYLEACRLAEAGLWPQAWPVLESYAKERSREIVARR